MANSPAARVLRMAEKRPFPPKSPSLLTQRERSFRPWKGLSNSVSTKSKDVAVCCENRAGYALGSNNVSRCCRFASKRRSIRPRMGPNKRFLNRRERYRRISARLCRAGSVPLPGTGSSQGCFRSCVQRTQPWLTLWSRIVGTKLRATAIPLVSGDNRERAANSQAPAGRE